MRVASRRDALRDRRIVGIARQVVAVGVAFLEQHVHDGAGQRAVGAGQRRKVQVGDLGRAGAVGIDDDEFGAALLPRGSDMRHHVDLGRDRVAAPYHDQVGFRDLAAIDAAPGADPGEPAHVGQDIADRRMLPRIAHRMTQPVDAVALHPPHRAGVVVRPDGFAPYRCAARVSRSATSSSAASQEIGAKPAARRPCRRCGAAARQRSG